jgi:cysteinyl-tRNA synthetase
MNNPEVARIAEMLRNTYNGSSWHGASMMEILNNVDTAQAFQSTSHIHRICELVQHITSWRIFAVKKLDGDQNFDVSQEENWKDAANQNESAWKEILAELEGSQEKTTCKAGGFF